MPFTNDAIRAEIHEWIRKDGSKVGRVTSATPLALNMHLVEVVWNGVQKMASKPVIFYVCNTTLEAALLDRQLKNKSFHGGKIGEQSVVRKVKGDKPITGIVLLSYATFRQLLAAENQSFPCRLVVICEQEPGMNMDAVVARGQFTSLARKSLVRQPGFNVKLLGLSYRQYRGKGWLDHAVDVMSTSPQTLSLDQTVSYTSGKQGQGPQAEKFARNEAGMRSVAGEAAGFLKDSQNVVVYGSEGDTTNFLLLVDEFSESGLPFSAHIQFATGIDRDPGLDFFTSLILDPVDEGKPGALLLVEPGSFSTPLPITNVGMVISIVTRIPRRVYDNGLHFVTSSLTAQSKRSLQSQRWTGWGRDGLDSPGKARVIEIFDLGKDNSMPKTDAHIQRGTHDPLRECFEMVAAYPGTALNLLPIFAAVDEPRDLAVRLRVMGLLVNQGNGFIMTDKGKRAKSFMEKEASLTLEGATALAGVDVRGMGEKVARSILRLSFIKDMSESFVQTCPMMLPSDGDFVSFLHNFTNDSVHGGPGRERIDRGLIWLIWVSFESGSWEVDVDGANLPPQMRPSQNCPLFCETAELKYAMRTLAAWERLLELGPLQDGQRDDWNTPLTLDEVTIVEHEIARANYSTILAIPFKFKRNGQLGKETLPSLWLRTNEPAEIRGEFDKHLHANRRAMLERVKLPPQPQEFILFGGLPLSVSTDEAGRTSVTGLMWFTYDVIKALMGDLQAEDADPWVRAVAMQD